MVSAEDLLCPLMDSHSLLFAIYNDELNSDVQVQFRSQQFYLHRCVVEARSALLKSMMGDVCNSGTEIVLDITVPDPEIGTLIPSRLQDNSITQSEFATFVRCLYSLVELSNLSVPELIVMTTIADSMGAKVIKDQCTALIAQKFTIADDVVVAGLKFAVRYQQPALLDKLLRHFDEHYDLAMSSYVIMTLPEDPARQMITLMSKWTPCQLLLFCVQYATKGRQAYNPERTTTIDPNMENFLQFALKTISPKLSGPHVLKLGKQMTSNLAMSAELKITFSEILIDRLVAYLEYGRDNYATYSDKVAEFW